MEDIKNLTDEQVKEVQTIVNNMLDPDADDKKITELNAMSTILDNDLFAMVDVAGDETKKATALQYKNYVGTGQEVFDATVGAVGSGADYNDINTAIAASKFNLLVVGAFTQPTDINTGVNYIYIYIAERLIFASANMTIGNNTGLKIRGKALHTAYTSGSHILFNGNNTTLLDIDGLTFLDTSSGGTVKLGNVSGGIHIIHNCQFVLPNNAACGFYNAGAGSSFTNLGVNGGGSLCKNFIDTAEQVIIDNIYFEPDTFEDGGLMIKIGSPSENLKAVAKISTMDNVVCGLGTATMLISVGSPSTQVSNINGSISLDYGANNCNTANCSVKDFIFTGNTDANYFVNCKSIGNTAITIGGDDSQFVNCNFNAAFTLDVGSNNNQFLLCKSTGGFTDNGTNNLFLAGTSGKFINSGYSGFGGSTTDFPALKFKRHAGTMPAAGNNLTVTAATLGLTSARQIVNGRLEAETSSLLWVADGNNILGTTKCDFMIPGAGHANEGDLLISTGIGATAIASQPFEFSYWYQATNFLGSEASKAATSSIASTT